MRRQYLAVVLLLGLLIAGRVVTRVWGASPQVIPTGRGAVSSFIMTIEGDSALPAVDEKVVVGEAGFRRRGSKQGAVFSLELGSASHDAAVLFSADGLGPVGPGVYQVDDLPGSRAMHALIVTGTPTHPTAVYRAQSGRLALQVVSGGELEGSFELGGRGFTAASPADEQVLIRVAGSFLATER